MPKTKISDYSQTAASNTDINSINLAEGMLPSDVNNAIRELMKQIKDFQVGAQSDSLTVGGGLVAVGTTTLKGLTMPTTDGTSGQVIQTNGSGILSFTNQTSLASPLAVTGNSTAGAEIRLPEDTDNGSNYVALKAPDTLASNVTFTLPSTDGTNGQILQTNGSGVFSFTNAATGDVTTTGTQTLTNKTLTDPAIVGTILEDVYTIADGAAFEVDPGNGSIQLITLGANRTPKATNFAAGESVLLMVDDGTAYTLTWTDATWGGSGVIWKTDSGSAPTLNTSGYTVISFWKVGTQIYGARVGNA